MATNIPPHNLTEVMNGLIKMIDNKINEDRETDIDELIEIIKGPDFPTGASIMGKMGIINAYKTGRGRIKMRSNCEIETLPSGRERIIVTEIPYQVNKSRMITGMADLVKEKKIEGISDIRDHSDRNGINIVIDCKKDFSAEIILNQLYKFSQLQETYSVNFLAIVDGVPRTLNLKQLLEYYLIHQEDVITRRTRFELDKAKKRMHIVDGLLVALDNIDEVINILRSSQTTQEAKDRLMERFALSEAQVNAICEMRFRALVGLEREKLVNEKQELVAFIADREEILSSKNRLMQVIRAELIDVRDKYGDERRTKLLPDAGEIDIEDLIEDELSVITMSHLNYVKRIPLDTYKSQNRGGKGIKGMQTREEDFVQRLFLSSNHSYILFFTNKGKVYRIKTWSIPEAGRNAKGMPLVNLLEMGEGEKINAIVPVKRLGDDQYLMMITKKGIIKKTTANSFNNIRKGGLIAVNLHEDDELISVFKTGGKDEIFVATQNGMSIHFSENDIRSMGRLAAGVRAIKLDEGNCVVGADVVNPELKVLLVTEKGYGKCTSIDEFKLQSRGGKGLKAYKVTEKTGNIIGLSMVNDNEELIMITSEGIVIRLRIKDIKTTAGRVTQGVKLVNIDENVKVVGIDKIREDSVNEEKETESINNDDVIE
jgi:DNA gyrase subunit A